MRTLLRSIADRVADFVESLPSRPVGVVASHDELLAALEKPLTDSPTPVDSVINDLWRDVEPGLVASTGPRYFGFVMGGVTPASLLADWLTSAWDQNAQAYPTSPAAAVVEEIVARWLLELLRLPADASVGFVTGCQMANFTALSAARNTVLTRAGWNLQANGLFGAPRIRVLMSDEAHATVRSALRMIGIGDSDLHVVPSDNEGRMRLDALQEQVREPAGSPMIISVQAGNVNSGAFEPIDAIADLVKNQNAWIHVDGAFGLWAAVSPNLRHLLQGLDRADSWATDAHKWLNVPYDSGMVMIKRPAEHRSLKTARCSYVGPELEGRRDGSSWAPENSRRARAFVLYAAIRAAGRSGIRSIVENCCELAGQFAAEAARLPFARILNEVVLNQVLIRFEPPEIDDLDAFHEAVAAEIQRSGVCWLGTTRWKGEVALRVSVTNWSTDAGIVAESVRTLGEVVESVAASLGTNHQTGEPTRPGQRNHADHKSDGEAMDESSQ
jgi:glutamate/tyrosine decarboxylase-like PLP-dependent enzyme